MIKYFHQLTKAGFKEILAEERTKKPMINWEEFAKMYPQPSWCSYSDAVCGTMGCWSLMGFLVTGEDYCKNCPEYNDLRGQKDE